MATLGSLYQYSGDTTLGSDFLPENILSYIPADDLNGDGNLDFLILGASYPIISNPSKTVQPGRFLLGDGMGGFTVATSAIFPNASLSTVHTRKVLFGDLNGDFIDDIFISNHGWDADPFPGEQNEYYLSDGTGAWSDETGQLPDLDDYSHTSAFGDIDHDGDLDIFVGNGYGGTNNIAAYFLLNDGDGNLTKSTSVLPVKAGGYLDFLTVHHFTGATFADLDGDDYPELIITADASGQYDKNLNSVVYWNNKGKFSDADTTLLPATKTLKGHIDLDAKSHDFNGDGLQDILIAGSQGDPFYDGWFVQILINDGKYNFSDKTSSYIAAADTSGGSYGAATNSPWCMWVDFLDFNGDGLLDFNVTYGGTLTQDTPLVWVNNGSGQYYTLKAGDFAEPGWEWALGRGTLFATDNGYSFFNSYGNSTGVHLTGYVATSSFSGSVATLAATRDDTAATDWSITRLAGTSGNDKLAGTAADEIINGGAGADKLSGGGGADSFVFDNLATGGADKIADFSVAAGDTLAFDAAVLTSLASGITANNVVIGAKVKALDADDYLLFATKGGKLYYDADGNGTGTAVLLAGIKGSLSGIDADCFVLD